MEILIFICGLLLFPISKHYLLLSTIEKLYLAKTKEASRLFNFRIDKDTYLLKFNPIDTLKIFFGYDGGS